MRCVSPLLFCHTTIRAPEDAGFGENDCEPICPTIEIVKTLLVGAVGLGAVELSLEPPPQAVKARATAKAPCRTAKTERIVTSFAWVTGLFTQEPYQPQEPIDKGIRGEIRKSQAMPMSA